MKKITKSAAVLLAAFSFLFSSLNFVSCDNGSSDDGKTVSEKQEKDPNSKPTTDPSTDPSTDPTTDPTQGGGTNPESPTAVLLDQVFIVGDITKGDWLPMTVSEDKKSATFTFDYDGAKMTKWGGGNGTGNFKISEYGDWNNPSFGGPAGVIGVEADGDEANLEAAKSGMGNIACSNFITENGYTITFVKTASETTDSAGKTVNAKGTIKIVTSKMVHEPVVVVEVPNEFKNAVFSSAKGKTVLYFSEDKLTIKDSDGLDGTYDYSVDNEGVTASFKISEKEYSVKLQDGSFKINFSENAEAENEETFAYSEDLLFIDGKTFAVTESDLNKCYIDNRDDDKIIFLYDFEKWAQTTKLKSAFVRGSFTSWKDKADYEMTYSKNMNLCYASVPYSKVSIIGNSGHPEYKFYVNGTYMAAADYDFITEGYCFHTSDNNLVILFEDDDLDSVIEQSNIAGTVKTLSDFDLTTRLGKEEVSNLRLVPGTTKLFRSYHPYYPSRPSYETEKTRLETLQALAVEEGIKSDINLTDDYTTKAGNEIIWADGSKSLVEIPEYYQAILDNESVLNVKTAAGKVPDYDTVYNKSNSDNFNEWVQVIVDFIIEEKHQAPFEIHCAIGTDRTGVFSALLGALCGATWDEVCVDYEKTNRMGINEYRSKALLAQSFRKMLGVSDMASVTNLKEALWTHFEETLLNGEPILTEAKLKALEAKLK